MRHSFVQDIDGLAFAGSRVQVSHGFARNWLVPRRLAQPKPADPSARRLRPTKVCNNTADGTCICCGNALGFTALNLTAVCIPSGRLHTCGQVVDEVYACFCATLCLQQLACPGGGQKKGTCTKPARGSTLEAALLSSTLRLLSFCFSCNR